MLRLHRNLYRIKRSIREKNPEKNFGNFSEIRKESRDEKVEDEKIEIIEIDSADIEIYKPKEKEIEKSKSWNNEKNLESYHKARDFLELQRAIDEATAIQESSKSNHASMKVSGIHRPPHQRTDRSELVRAFKKICGLSPVRDSQFFYRTKNFEKSSVLDEPVLVCGSMNRLVMTLRRL